LFPGDTLRDARGGKKRGIISLETRRHTGREKNYSNQRSFRGKERRTTSLAGKGELVNSAGLKDFLKKTACDENRFFLGENPGLGIKPVQKGKKFAGGAPPRKILVSGGEKRGSPSGPVKEGKKTPARRRTIRPEAIRCR